MMSNNSDYVNNLLNRLAYVDLGEDYTPGCNLITALRNGGDPDLADALEDAGYGNYVIRDYANQNDSNGFAAIAIEDPVTGDVGISYRGTENLDNMGNAISSAIGGNVPEVKNAINNQIDMIDNISTAVTGDSPQAQQALAFFQNNQSDTGNNYLYGHSKGGELALEVYVENYNSIENVHIINPQPVNWASLSRDQLLALNNGKIDATVINGDLVWLLGGVPYPVRIIENNGVLDGEFFGPHMLESAHYNPNTGEAYIEDRPYVNYLGQGLLGTGFSGLISMVQAGYGYTQRQLAWIPDAYHFFTEDLPDAAHRFWDSVNNAWTEAKEFVGETTQNVGDFFSDLSENFSNWWSEHFGNDNQDGTSSSGRSSSEPARFQVDIQQLRQAATHLASVSRNLDALENTIGGYAQSMRRISFIGTVALQTSLLGVNQKTRHLSTDVQDLADALTDIADLYSQSENRIRGNCHS